MKGDITVHLWAQQPGAGGRGEAIGEFQVPAVPRVGETVEWNEIESARRVVVSGLVISIRHLFADGLVIVMCEIVDRRPVDRGGN